MRESSYQLSDCSIELRCRMMREEGAGGLVNAQIVALEPTNPRMLHLDVWDHDSKSNHDLIGSVDILMPNLAAMMSSGQKEVAVCEVLPR